MAAADVELVVRKVSSRDVVGDHREAVGPHRAGRFLNLQPVDERRGRHGLCLRRVGGHKYRFVLRGKAQLKVQNWRRAGEYGNALLVRGEVQVRNRDSVFAKRNSIKMKLPRIVRSRRQTELRRARFQNNFDAGNWAVLWIVDDAAHRAENRGKSRSGERKK